MDRSDKKQIRQLKTKISFEKVKIGILLQIEFQPHCILQSNEYMIVEDEICVVIDMFSTSPFLWITIFVAPLLIDTAWRVNFVCL